MHTIVWKELSVKRTLLVFLVALGMILVFCGSALAASGSDGATLNQRCLKDPSLVSRLTPAERATLLEYVTPVSSYCRIVDPRTGKTLSEVTGLAGSSNALGGVMPMSSQYYTWYPSANPCTVYYECGEKNVFGITLWSMTEGNTWSWNASTGKINYANYSGPTVHTFVIGWAWAGVVSQSSSQGSYYYQHLVQGHFSFNLAGYQAANKYPIIDFTDWANSPARMTWHWII
jgi:hypothetical protein